jgi:hypothetical protein
MDLNLEAEGIMGSPVEGGAWILCPELDGFQPRSLSRETGDDYRMYVGPFD